MSAPEPLKVDLTEAAREGIDLCKRGHWDEGLLCLNQALKADRQSLPGTAYSYLGYAMALRENKLWEGLNLAQLGVEVGYFDADNYYNLARIYLMRDNRRQAVLAVEEGLKVESEHRGLLQLQARLGKRSKPIFPFLSRDHVLNMLFGRIRHTVKSSREKAKTKTKKKAQPVKKKEVPNLFDL
ncbi:hypothetical protein SCOR_28960 [Sulfidibacter corallicola]|uniref:Tetratricopeptide repeat protein n=1 Tax=Sulfidibacter corallicola TaxID=2818388 RepID=A0A8A4TLH0_SULCO|nr:hypothetical protein [Sulfidibacter corallicola]QTD50413.1 hypothetical protein J3U87_32925 [Sulfidibacter corallicola]